MQSHVVMFRFYTLKKKTWVIIKYSLFFARLFKKTKGLFCKLEIFFGGKLLNTLKMNNKRFKI